MASVIIGVHLPSSVARSRRRSLLACFSSCCSATVQLYRGRRPNWCRVNNNNSTECMCCNNRPDLFPDRTYYMRVDQAGLFGRPFVKRFALRFALSYRTVVCLSSLWRWCIMIKRLDGLGCHLVCRYIGLDPGHIVLDGDPTPHPQKMDTAAPPLFGSCLLRPISVTLVYFAAGGGARYCDERVCLSVCLSARIIISQTTRPIITKFSARVNRAWSFGPSLMTV